MRVFVAVDISAEARRRAGERIENLRRQFSDLRVGWEKPEKLHLTLKFLGEIQSKILVEVKSAVENAVKNTDVFTIAVEGAGAFPPRGAGRVLWLGFKDKTQSLRRISQRLETVFEQIGFEREKRDFSPHLTIARLKEPAKARELTVLHLQTDFPPIEFEVSEVVVYKSDLKPSGSVYTPLAKIDLKKEKA